ncbi:unnamed protein product [Angiostrongylus costaricensis]|uniref:ANK_REP_REGION domain-containing protein n=1 Tax=Angiostrongylus costaricensis TaxID=334426 RepID=A0A158PD70_ANGCS|nr:unnamed protein product [Angiostrongylus costaricensis]
MEACAAGNVRSVKCLLDLGADVNAYSISQNTPLIYAAAAGQEKVVRMLIEQKCNLDLRNENGHCALMEAASAGHLNIVKLLIHSGAKAVFVNMNSEFKESPLTLAAYKGYTDVIEYLLSLDDYDHSTRDEELHTALMEAAMDGHLEVARVLIQAGAPVNLTSEAYESPLTLSCCGGHAELAKLLIDAGANIEETNDENYTPLMEAAREGYVHVVKVLLENGAEVNATTDETMETALTVAACGGFTLVVLFTDLPADRSVKFRQQMNQALSLASENGHFDVLQVLHSNGADLVRFHLYNFDYDGRTALMKAAKNGFTEIVEFLVTKGADVNTRSSNGDATALSLACSAGHREIVKLLLKCGADPNIELKCDFLFLNFQDGVTCVMEAARNGFVNIVEMMLDHSGVFPQPPRPVAGGVLPQMDKGSPPIPPPPPPTPTASVKVTVFNLASYHFSNTSALTWFASLFSGLGDGNTPAFPSPGSGCSVQPTATSSISAAEMKARVEAFEMLTKTSPFLMQYPPNMPMVNPFDPQAPVPGTGLNSNPLTLADVSIPAIHEMLNCADTKQNAQNWSEYMRKRFAVQTAMYEYLPQRLECVAGDNLSIPRAASLPTQSLSAPSTPGMTLDKYQTVSFRATASQRAAFNVDKATESNNDTPLTLACSNGHAQMVDVLVCRGANIEHRDKKGFTPLILAATGGHRDVVELLLNSGAQIEAQSERTKDTALSLACSGGRKEVVELLLSRGANKLGISPLMLAAMNGHKEATRVLLEQGSDINAQIETNRNTALTLACFQGRTEVVGLLLQYNANVEHRAKTGLTPLMEAANGGYVEVGELLLDACADPNTAPVPSSRDTALTIAADKGHERFVDMLVNRGAHIDARNKKVYSSNCYIVERSFLLLSVVLQGCTALWLACHGGHLETVQTLVKHGADVDMQDNRKMSPLMVAFRKGHVKVGLTYRAIKSIYLQNLVVQHMVQHVRQFPGDQELSRYLTTISEADLLQNCRECMDLIVKAKNAQAEEANRAAESLLALLAEEEEAARSKKQAKMRKKEKRKEKKAKKQDFTEKERNVATPAETQTRVQQSSPINRVKEESENNDRVPKMRAVEEQLPSSVVSERSSVSLNRQQKRSAIRRSRNESGKSSNGQTLTPLSNTVVSSKNAVPSVLVSKSAVHADDWVKASKKSKASRRRSSTLSVGSSVIARVIGRGGANINAIREATGASIEVEKQSATLKKAKLPKRQPLYPNEFYNNNLVSAY